MPKSLSIRTSLLVLLSLLTLLLLLTGGMGLYASTRIITSWVYYGVMTGGDAGRHRPAGAGMADVA
ncbi:methyl-accepting chemotaxis protein II [Citrobacter koseri]|nr:methyl-accepting chemotaxis protein II [Citrobacter koseri]